MIKRRILARCNNCNKHNASSICSGCFVAWYCSKECQTANYSEHAFICTRNNGGDVYQEKIRIDYCTRVKRMYIDLITKDRDSFIEKVIYKYNNKNIIPVFSINVKYPARKIKRLLPAEENTFFNMMGNTYYIKDGKLMFMDGSIIMDIKNLKHVFGIIIEELPKLVLADCYYSENFQLKKVYLK